MSLAHARTHVIPLGAAAAPGCRMLLTTPAEDPVLWERYLRGAVATYRSHGVDAVVDVAEVATGAGTTLFVAVVDEDDVVHGGMRVQGPYLAPEDSHALVEFAGSESCGEVRRLIGAMVADGVLEVKTAWVSARSPHRRALATAIPRAAVHAADLVGARYVFATSALHSLRTWCTTGAEIAPTVVPVAYPDERYLTSMIVLDRSRVVAGCEPGQLRELLAEQAQLHLDARRVAAA